MLPQDIGAGDVLEVLVGTKDKRSHEQKQPFRLAGEFAVVSDLSRNGYSVSLQWEITKQYVLITSDVSPRIAYLEVKTSLGPGWVIGGPGRKLATERYFYTLVRMCSTCPPDTFCAN